MFWKTQISRTSILACDNAFCLKFWGLPNWAPAMLHTKFQASSCLESCFSKIQIWPRSAVNRVLNVWCLKDRLDLLFLKAHETNVEAYFFQADGRLLKLSLFSTVLDKSPLTSIYFITFEKKRKVRSPLLRQSNYTLHTQYATYVFPII